MKANNSIEFRIIIIDDNPAIHKDFMKILTNPASEALDALSQQMFGITNTAAELLPQFHINTASQGLLGIEMIKNAIAKKTPYALAFVDIRMPPGLDGVETIKRIWELDKDIQVVICTAFSDYSWEETVQHLGKTDNLLILKKPFDNISVRQLACALTKKWQLLRDTRQFTESLKQQVDNRTALLQKSLSLVKATLESSNEGIIVLNREGKVVDYNQKLISLWNIPAEILENSKHSAVLDYMKKKVKEPETFLQWLQSLHDENKISSIEIIELLDGEIFDCYSQPQKLNEQIVGRVLNFRDITARNKLEKKLQYQALHDSLTGLPNRTLLFQKFEAAVKTVQTKGTMIAVVFLDLDRFKLINDSLGHAAGDNLLHATAKRLKNVICNDDTLARLGGDEFVMLLPNIDCDNAIKEKVNKLTHIFEHPFQLEEREIKITASIGVSIYPQDGQTADELLRHADAAMYDAKANGKHGFQAYTSHMSEKSLEKLNTEIQLHEALIRNELILCYQPQFHTNTGALISVEALLRWQHPKLGLLLPIDFIPIAEETGMIVPIGEWAIRTACQQCKKWYDAGFLIRVAVNITAQQLKQQNIVDIIRQILVDTALPPKYLELELTENALVNSTEAINVIFALKEMGISIAIDDFGTGYSNLSYLRNLPLNRLKIDKSFINNIKSETDDEIIIRAIIAVAKQMNLEVLAEGVETQNQVNFLKNQNCDEMQGFYLSKPLTILELEEFMIETLKKTESTT